MTIISNADARRAIYIDFECVKTDPPQPELLGVLIGGSLSPGSRDEPESASRIGVAGGDELEQLIIDERLASARAARRDGLRVVSAGDAVDAIVHKAIADDRRIVGWSDFDRDRLLDARPDLANEIRARYVNALRVARPWRIKVHPTFAIEREDQFSPKHTLDKYAVLARYPHAAALSNATPAKWIRHTLQQLKAKGGRYRSTTKQAKRDWHRLLDYNRHDLLALRHVVFEAVRELARWRAYERTRFCVELRRRWEPGDRWFVSEAPAGTPARAPDGHRHRTPRRGVKAGVHGEDTATTAGMSAGQRHSVAGNHHSLR